MSSSREFSEVPSAATLSPKPFTAQVPDEKLKQMKDILKISPIGPAVWENTCKDQGSSALNIPSRILGMRRDYLQAAKDQWLNVYDWRKTEERINALPNFTVDIASESGETYNVHFLALFSQKADAVPLITIHGWPGSFLEFLPILNILKEKYTPQNLPYHVIVPSLPGYAFSDGPPANVDFSVTQVASILHKLMLGLGFPAYLCQGGDIGSITARKMAAMFPECRGIHVNMFHMPKWVDIGKNDSTMSSVEAASMARRTEFSTRGYSYALEHGQRTATIGLALSTSPLGLFAWIGEKFLEWTDDDPSLDDILDSVSLYWLTETFQRCIYPYRRLYENDTAEFLKKPTGFSFFPKEILPTPKNCVEQACELVAYYSHERGGHFAAFEVPEVLLADVEDWVPKVWKG